MLLIHNIGQLLCFDDDDLGWVDDAAILIDGEEIFWCGEEASLPSVKIDEKIDAHKKLVMPGLIDCHSHLIFAGTRAAEFLQRMDNQSYQAIMAKGGGIMSTVHATRQASDEELLGLAMGRLDSMLAKGVTTLEAKSGYGLSVEDELRTLRLMKKLQAMHALELHPTFLGAHVVPVDYKNNPDDYVKLITEEMLPLIVSEKLALDCDVFCEKGAFSIVQSRSIFKEAHRLGLGLRAHLLQLSHQDSLTLLQEFPIKSISHADFLRDEDVARLANMNTVVEIVPIAALFLRAKQMPPVQALYAAGVKMAVSTDFNPGSAMCDDLILATRLAVTMMLMPPTEALKAITINAALALGKEDRGSIAKGKKADILLTNCDGLGELLYDWTKHPARLTIKNGKPVRKVHEEDICSSS